MKKLTCEYQFNAEQLQNVRRLAKGTGKFNFFYCHIDSSHII